MPHPMPSCLISQPCLVHGCTPVHSCTMPMPSSLTHLPHTFVCSCPHLHTPAQSNLCMTMPSCMPMHPLQCLHTPTHSCTMLVPPYTTHLALTLSVLSCTCTCIP